MPSPFTGTPQATSFRPETAYEFRFDTNGDAKPAVIFRFLFQGETTPQYWTLHYISGADAQDPDATGQEIGSGVVEETAAIADVGRVWIGLADDPFTLDTVAARILLDKIIQSNQWEPDSFSTGNSTTGATNVLEIVAELSLAIISPTPFGFYGTVCANDHEHWTQVHRCGKPNFTATFNDNPEGSRLYNATDPTTNYANFAQPTIDRVAKV